jgi:methionyl-tRNA formyltransferase
MRLVFMGTPEFAVASLDAVVAAGHEVVLVVAQPDKPAGRGQTVRSPPTIERARALGIPVAQPSKIKTGEFPALFQALAPDVAVVVAYGRILTGELLAIPKLGCLNVHASLLPRWRGAAPIQAAILAGDAETGVCVQKMAEGLDTGPVYRSRTTPIGPRETAGELHDRLMVLGADALVETLAGLPDLAAVPQDDAKATTCGKIDKDAGLVDWNEPVVSVDRRIRAMTPWPGGAAAFKDASLKLVEAAPVEDPNLPWATRRFATLPRWDARPPGTVLAVRPLVVKCADGGLELIRVQAAGRKPVPGQDFANGAHLLLGDAFA